MAIASALQTTTPNGDIDAGVKFFYVFITITPSGSYVSGGDTFDLTAITRPVGAPPLPGGGAAVAPLPTQVTINSRNGYSYSYVPGTTRANGKLKVNTAANTELSAGAYPAGVTGDVITAQIVFPRF